MADLLRLSCSCGYATEVADGGLFAGAVELFVCGDCRAVVGVLTWRSGHRGEEPGQVSPKCPDCGGKDVAPWRRSRCPRCGEEMIVESVGIAD